jgi:ferredoxin-thioredoxin reductase catalytic subunit
MTEISLEKVKERAEIDAKRNGYYLNPDPEFLKSLLEGLKQNEKRYNYPSCPCRLASGKIELDRDIICPCDYRDPDVMEFGACYCALYVDEKVNNGTVKLGPVPERRTLEKQAKAFSVKSDQEQKIKAEIVEETKLKIEVKLELWYCKQCGYVAFREEAPLICPICKAKKEMFAKIKTQVKYST